MARSPSVSVEEAVGTRLVESLVGQDWIALESCFDKDVQFRALTPHALREALDGITAAGYFLRWFGDADQLELLACDVAMIEDRLSIRYRIRAHEDRWYVIEQRAYCDVTAGQITHIDLLCSGFLPAA